MTQPEAMNRAIKLALRLECAGQNDAAAELRRLHEVNQELLAALKAVCETCDWHGDDGQEAMSKARSVIAKGEQK